MPNLRKNLNQSVLGDIRNEINQITDENEKMTRLYLLDKLKRRNLECLIKELSLGVSGNLLAEFNNSKFKKYNKIDIFSSGKCVAEVSMGHSTILGCLATS